MNGGVALVLHLIRTDSLSLTQAHILAQIHSAALRFTQSHPDPPSLIQICCLTQIHSDSLRFPQIHPDPHRFAQTHLNYIDKS